MEEFKFEFTDIYLSETELRFYDSSKGKYLEVRDFDVIVTNKKLLESKDIWQRLDYFNPKQIGLNCIIKIAQDDFIFYFVLANGDIIQWYYLSEDECLNRILSIYGEIDKKIYTPLGISVYQAVWNRVICSEALNLGINK